MKRRRKKGTGTLFKRGTIWYARWVWKGVEKTISTGEEVKSRAEEVLMKLTQPFRLANEEAMLNELARQVSGVQGRFKEAIEEIEMPVLGRLEEIYRASPKRIDSSERQYDTLYKRVIKRLVSFLGEGFKIVNVGEEEATSFAQSLTDVSPNTFNKFMMGLAEVWRAVGASVGVSVNPWEGMKRKRLDTVQRRNLTDGEVDRIIDLAEGEEKVLVLVGVYTGLRLGDAVLLRYESFKDGMKFIDVKTSKTGAKTSIPVHPRLAEVLSDKKEGYVMPNLAAKHKKDRASVSKLMVRLFKSAGIDTTEEREGGRARPVCTFHSLRHTFVSRAIAAGVPIHIVQQIVGHSRVIMTEHYTHITDENVLENLAKVR